MTAQRFPLGPLLALTGASTPWALGRLAGVEPHTVSVAARRGGLTPTLADRLAVAYGYHPAEVWGDDWWWRGFDPEERRRMDTAFRRLRREAGL